jgi:hypothetical protein
VESEDEEESSGHIKGNPQGATVSGTSSQDLELSTTPKFQRGRNEPLLQILNTFDISQTVKQELFQSIKNQVLPPKKKSLKLKKNLSKPTELFQSNPENGRNTNTQKCGTQ